jgi:DNA-binding beta-propeller fold protein YncE
LNTRNHIHWLFATLLVLASTSCTWDNLGDEAAGYPTEISAIIVNSCAVSGCHNAASSEAAAGLNLESWATLYEGSRGGSAVIPYSPEMSYLLYAVNTNPDKGPMLSPTMPIGGATLTDAEYDLLEQWIADGARNAKGEERFPPVANRRKWYVANQGCDHVAVMDAESRQVMRYVPVGTSAAPESPHYIKTSKDGQYWYVIFLANNPSIEKYSTLTDSKVGGIHIGIGNWNTFNISGDGKFAIAVAYEAPGTGILQAVIVDLVNDVVTEQIGNFGFSKPHGSAAHPTLPFFYVTMQDENSLVKVEYDANGRVQSIEPVDLRQGIPGHTGDGILRPHEVVFTPDGSKYFVSCQTAREVRAYQTSNDSLIAIINVGDDPVEFTVDPVRGRLFVSCMDDVTSFPGEPNKRGSVAIIEYTPAVPAFLKAVYTGYQPHGLVVDEASGICLVANRNVNSDGPAPHHSSFCGGRNGYVTAIDLNTLELVPGFKSEMSSDPYAVALKQ